MTHWTETGVWLGLLGSQEMFQTDLLKALQAPAGGMGSCCDSKTHCESGLESNDGAQAPAGGTGQRVGAAALGGGFTGEDLFLVLSKALSEAVGARMEKMMEVCFSDCYIWLDYESRGSVSHQSTEQSVVLWFNGCIGPLASTTCILTT